MMIRLDPADERNSYGGTIQTSGGACRCQEMQRRKNAARRITSPSADSWKPIRTADPAACRIGSDRTVPSYCRTRCSTLSTSCSIFYSNALALDRFAPDETLSDQVIRYSIKLIKSISCFIAIFFLLFQIGFCAPEGTGSVGTTGRIHPSAGFRCRIGSLDPDRWAQFGFAAATAGWRY